MDSDSGLILSVGSSVSLNEKFDDEVDLKGRLVLPAFTEGHCHLMKGAMVKHEIDLRQASGRKDFADIINAYRRNLKKNEWIEGGYFSETNFKENIIVDRSFLDSICSDIPVILSRIDLHSAVANSKALEITGMDSKKDIFTSDELLRDNKGNLTGEIKERARYYILDSIPQKNDQQKKLILKKQIKYLHALGITSVTDITWDGDLDIYKLLLESGEIKLRINSALRFDNIYEFEKITEFFNNTPENRVSQAGKHPLVKFGAFKEFYDGALSSESALFIENYKGAVHNGTRSEYVNSESFIKTGIEIDKLGYQIMVHAIGDLAVREVLDFVKMLNKVNGKRDRRFRIEHAQHIHPSDFLRFKELDIIASVQPSHLYVDAKVASEKVYDPSGTHNYKYLADNGILLCFGTDFPVASENPFETIYYAMTRTAKGFPDGFYHENALDLITCLNAYTANNAYAGFDENYRGKISPAMAADIIVLDRDIFNCTPEEIKNTGIEMTFFAGTRVY